MKNLFVTFALTAILASTVEAGVPPPEEIFASGFEGVEACADFDSVGDAIIIPFITVSGDLTLNGGAFPADEYDDAIISLRDRETDNVFEIGNTHDQNFSARIIPGYYDVMYSVEDPGEQVPHNVDAVLMEDVALLDNVTLDIDVTKYTLSGLFRLDGNPFPANEYDDAELHLSGETAGRLLVGETKFGSFVHVPVLPGAYEIRYQVQSPGSIVPWNQWGLVGQVNVTGNNAALIIDVPSIELSGTFKQNGAAMPGNDFDDGNFYLETAAGDRVFLDNSNQGSYTRNVIPGNFNLYWEVETPGATVPINSRARIGQNINIGAGTLNIDLDTYIVSGDVSLNLGTFPASASHYGQIVFRDTATGDDTVVLRTDQATSYNAVLTRANYDVLYEYLIGTQVPKNRDALLLNVTVKSDLDADLSVLAREVSADVFHNGVLFPLSQTPTASIIFRDIDSEDWALVGNTSSQTVTAIVVADTYDVYYSYNGGNDIPRNTNVRILADLVVEPLIGPSLTRGVGGLELHVSSIPITGQFYLNDVLMPADPNDDGLIRLRLGADAIFLGRSSDQGYNARIVETAYPQQYEIYWEVENRGDNVPANGNTHVGCMLLDPVLF